MRSSVFIFVGYSLRGIYNGLGQRVSQTVSAVLTGYLLDMQPGLWKVIAADDGTDVNRFIHEPVTGRILQHEDPSNNWNWPALDGLGTVRGVYDDTLTEVYAADRDPYGDLIAATGTNPTPFEYTGEPEDQNGLLHLRARYYDPSRCVFNSLDPAETPNRYAYVGGNPINLADHCGLYGELPEAISGTCQASLNPCGFTVDGDGNIVERPGNHGQCRDVIGQWLNRDPLSWWCAAYDHESECSLSLDIDGNLTKNPPTAFCSAYVTGLIARNPNTFAQRAGKPIPEDILIDDDYETPGNCRTSPLAISNQCGLPGGLAKITANVLLLHLVQQSMLLGFNSLLEETAGITGSFGVLAGAEYTPTNGWTSSIGGSAAVMVNSDLSACSVFTSEEYGGGLTLDPGIINAGLVLSTASVDELSGISLNFSFEVGVPFGLSVANNSDCDLTIYIGPPALASLPSGSVTYSKSRDLGSCEKVATDIINELAG